MLAAVHQHAREVRPAEVFAAAHGHHFFHGDALEARLLRAQDHALHAIAPFAQHGLRELAEGGRGLVEEVPEDVHLAPVQLAGELDARHEPHAVSRCRSAAFADARDRVVVGHREDGDARGRRFGEQVLGRAVAVAVQRVGMEVDQD